MDANEGRLFLVSGSDDFTLFMWKPETEKKSQARMTGHQQLVNDVKFR
jgi:ribosome assembly protein 4